MKRFLGTLISFSLLPCLGALATGCGGDDDSSPLAEICANASDDDSDGAIDCADPDCTREPSCAGAEVCDDQTDNDSDDAVDCADPDCAEDAACASAEVCDDEADNDGDGSADCADPDCASAPGCVGPELCEDQTDNDRDGAVDCADPDCASASNCISTCPGTMPLGDPATITGNTTGLSDIARGSCQQAGGADAVYSVIPANTDVVEITLTSDADLGLFVHTVCADTASELGCADESSGAGAVERLILNNVAAGQPLYILVGGHNSFEQGTFTLEIASRAIACGDDIVDAGEGCDDGNTTPGDGCDASCMPELGCGNGVPEPGEGCDDGNTTPGDGCSATCTVESVTEAEPNEDGTPQTGGTGTVGNDFATANANGPYAEDVAIQAAISPVGDEDVFAITNTGPFAASVRFDIYDSALGVGVACTDTDTVLRIRDAGGNSLALNDDRNRMTDRCSGLDFSLAPGQTVYAHIMEFSDNDPIAGYFLVVAFATCGDGLIEGQEQCDDGNNAPGDGCSQDCVIEAICGNGVIESGEECDDGNTMPGDGCDASCQLETDCGNGIFEPGEECDDGNATAGDGCSPTCELETTCGDGVIEPGEECDDGNTAASDGCGPTCQVESVSESEPNDDGTPQTGGLGTQGNDFNAANANGPFSTGTIVEASLMPAGDEDVFAVTNTGSFVTSVRFDLYNADIGLGAVCGTTIDTGLQIRNAAGMSLASNDNRNGAADRCSGLDFLLMPGATVFAHVVDFADNTAIPGYFLHIQFATCGNGVREGLEQCDDGNNTPGDGCNANCQSE